jgi:hypothetical protein
MWYKIGRIQLYHLHLQLFVLNLCLKDGSGSCNAVNAMHNYNKFTAECYIEEGIILNQ